VGHEKWREKAGYTHSIVQKEILLGLSFAKKKLPNINKPAKREGDRLPISKAISLV